MPGSKTEPLHAEMRGALVQRWPGMTWVTRLPPERTRTCGVEELHAAWLLPPGFPGRGPVVSLSLPECRLQYMPGIAIADVPILWMFDRPRRTVAHSIKDACRLATEANACLFILADNARRARHRAERTS